MWIGAIAHIVGSRWRLRRPPTTDCDHPDGESMRRYYHDSMTPTATPAARPEKQRWCSRTPRRNHRGVIGGVACRPCPGRSEETASTGRQTTIRPIGGSGGGVDEDLPLAAQMRYAGRIFFATPHGDRSRSEVVPQRGGAKGSQVHGVGIARRSHTAKATLDHRK